MGVMVQRKDEKREWRKPHLRRLPAKNALMPGGTTGAEGGSTKFRPSV